jgi:Rrf2 family protein
LELSTKAEYGVRAAIDLARCGDEQSTFHAIADRQSIPPKFMPQIMRDLAKAGLVVTTRGFRGGVRLARPAHQITLRAVVEAIEGPMALYRCLASPAACERSPYCTLRPVWVRAQDAMLDVLGRTLLSHLARNGRARRSGSRS